MASGKKFEDLDLSKDEVERLTNALKNEEFRKLFVEYAEEISNPENKARYEAEIAELEREKGMDVKFIHPEPGYVVKTTVNGDTKAFINICKNENVAKPSSKRTTGPDGRPGLSWSVPHSFAPPRDDVDKNGSKCKVYDFVVHQDTYRMAETNTRFKNMLHDTAFDGIEKQFDLKVERRNLKFPKLKFKGVATPTVIRTRNENEAKDKKEPDDIMSKFPNPYGQETTEEKMKKREAEIEKREKDKKVKEEQQLSEKNAADEYETPKYSIKYRSQFDMQSFSAADRTNTNIRPDHLVLEIDLPLIKSASSVNLDIFEKRVVLVSESPAKYKLDIPLSFPVNENEGSAKFDKTKKKLIVSLPVISLQETVNQSLMNGHSNTVSNENSNRDPEFETPPEKNALIQVISEETKETESASPVEEEASNEKSEPKKHYTMPPYECFQDDESVTIILKVTNVIRESVEKSFGSSPPYETSIKMTSLGSGGFPMDFSFCVHVLDDCHVEANNCRTDISDDNVVVVIVKSDESIGAWDKLLVGPDSSHLEEKLLLTLPNMKNKLDALEQDLKAATQTSKGNLPSLEVTCMNTEKLEIHVEGDTVDGEKELSSPESIEVVHDNRLPKLQGILKQRSRTVSESSDDVSRGYSRQNSCSGVGFTSGESSLLESDENDSESSSPRERKKSVSFSEHIDKTTYKSNASVSTMKNALKSKRRRQRKREQKQQERQVRTERRRRRSSGSYSEQSSDDQYIVKDATIENDHSDEEEETAADVSSRDAAVSGKCKADADAERTRNGCNDATPAPVNASVNAESAEMPPQQAQTDVIDNTANLANVDSNQLKGHISQGHDEVDEDDTVEPVPASEQLKKDNYKSETMLSWEEKSPVHNPFMDKPKCEIDFGNSVMFDLDVD